MNACMVSTLEYGMYKVLLMGTKLTFSEVLIALKKFQHKS